MYTEEINSKKVADLMSKNILVGHVTNSFTHTLRLFSEMTFHHLPIVDSKQQLLGMVSSNDLLKELALRLPMLKDVKEETINEYFEITEIMTPQIKVIAPDATISEALEIFSKYHIQILTIYHNIPRKFY